jgi:hypothetical protein
MLQHDAHEHVTTGYVRLTMHSHLVGNTAHLHLHSCMHAALPLHSPSLPAEPGRMPQVRDLRERLQAAAASRAAADEQLAAAGAKLAAQAERGAELGTQLQGAWLQLEVQERQLLELQRQVGGPGAGTRQPPELHCSTLLCGRCSTRCGSRLCSCAHVITEGNALGSCCSSACFF